MKLLTAAQLDNYNPRKDKTISIRFITQEKTPAEVAEIHGMIDTFGYLMFKAEEQLTKEEIESLEHLDTDLYDNPKTQSQRLRGVLYKVWEQYRNNIDSRKNYVDKIKALDFKDFYKQETEKIIQHYKNKLQD